MLLLLFSSYCCSLSAILSKFECNAFLILTTGAEELYVIKSFCWTTTFVEHFSKAASLFWKAGENLRETHEIIIQIPSSSS